MKQIRIYNCKICEDQGDYYIVIPGLGIDFLRDCECKRGAINNPEFEDNRA